MNNEERLSLEKVILSQTWNQSLARRIINAIAMEAKKPKRKKETSALQRAVEEEKGKSSKPAQDNSAGFEE